MHGFLGDIGIAIIVATVVGIIAYRTRQPLVVSYLIAGIIIGPEIGPTLIKDPANIELITEFGLILLLFIIGLEIDMKGLFRMGKSLIIPGLGQFLLTVPMGILFFSLIGPGHVKQSGLIYMAVFGAISSTAIVVKSLYDKFELDSLHGRISVGILVFQDLWAIIILVVQPTLLNPMVAPIVIALGKGMLLLTSGFLFSRYILRYIFELLTKSPEMVVATAIGWCALMAGLAAWLGLSLEMGALIAGLAISSFPYSIQVTTRVLPLRDVFLTLFFVSLGMKIPMIHGEIVGGIFLLVIFTIASRFLTVYPLIRLSGGSNRTAFISSLNLSQVSEFSLVIGTFGLKYGHISRDILSIALYAMAITSIISSYFIKYNHQLFSFFKRMTIRTRDGTGVAMPDENEKSTKEENRPIFILGYYRGAQALINILSKKNPGLLEKITVVDFNLEALTGLQHLKVHGVLGDLSDPGLLEHAGIARAQIILSTIPDLLLKGTSNLQLVKTCRHLAPRAKIFATADFHNQQEELMAAGADTVVMPNHYVGELLQKILLRTEAGRK